ncbi:MAG: hypothetical protein P8180_06165 [Gammaproteobacteria bacterium]|jgi:hypothetical protein
MVVSPMAASAMPMSGATPGVTHAAASAKGSAASGEANESAAAEQSEAPAQQASEGEKGSLINVHA